MDINNPFETFQHTAFRLEGLPQYLVDDEARVFNEFKRTGQLPDDSFGTDWSELVSRAVGAGKTVQRLRLLSDKLTDYEKFETQVYPGLHLGERIRSARRSDYKYVYDFWMFDDRWIARMNYGSDGAFVDLDIREATDAELQDYHYWLGVFERSTPLM